MSASPFKITKGLFSISILSWESVHVYSLLMLYWTHVEDEKEILKDINNRKAAQ